MAARAEPVHFEFSVTGSGRFMAGPSSPEPVPVEGHVGRGFEARANPCWVHLPAVLLAVAGLGLLNHVLGDALTPAAALAQLPRLLYWWVPPAVGIAAVTVPAGPSGRRLALGLAAVGVFSLVALDLIGGRYGADPAPTAVLTRDGQVQTVARGAVMPESWVLTLGAWLSGGMPGAAETVARYPVGHPRPLVVRALAEAGAPFFILGLLGAMLALKRWIRGNVTFRTPGTEITALVVLAWLLLPMLTTLAWPLTVGRVTAALFQDGSLLAILAPSLVIGALGVAGALYALRRSSVTWDP